MPSSVKLASGLSARPRINASPIKRETASLIVSCQRVTIRAILIGMLYSVANVKELFGVGDTTLKNWCKLAAPFLSPAATPPGGRHRAFTQEDLSVLGIIKTAPDYQSAYATLLNGQRAEVSGLVADFSLAIQNEHQVIALRDEIARLKAELETLRGERDRRIAAEAKLDLLRELLAEALKK